MIEILAVVILAILGLALLVNTIRVLPVLMLFIWPSRVRSSFESQSLDQVLVGGDHGLAELIQIFKELGFSPIGLKAERLPLWGPSIREASLVSKAKESYASIILHPDSSPASMYCFTPFVQGGMVFTRDFAAGEEAEGAQLSVQNVPEATPAELVSRHIQRVELFRERGMVPSVGASEEARLEATNAFYLSAYAKRSQRRILWPHLRRWAILCGAFVVLCLLIGSYPLSP